MGVTNSVKSYDVSYTEKAECSSVALGFGGAGGREGGEVLFGGYVDGLVICCSDLF